MEAEEKRRGQPSIAWQLSFVYGINHLFGSVPMFTSSVNNVHQFNEHYSLTQ